MKEIWINIDGYLGSYQISNTGKVKSLKNKERIMKPQLNKGYYQVALCFYGKRSIFTIHRLVAISFVKNDSPEVRIYVNHIDGNKLNNNAVNLEWCTSSENQKHSYAIGTHPKTNYFIGNKGKEISLKQIK